MEEMIQYFYFIFLCGSQLLVLALERHKGCTSCAKQVSIKSLTVQLLFILAAFTNALKR